MCPGPTGLLTGPRAEHFRFLLVGTKVCTDAMHGWYYPSLDRHSLLLRHLEETVGRTVGSLGRQMNFSFPISLSLSASSFLCLVGPCPGLHWTVLLHDQPGKENKCSLIWILQCYSQLSLLGKGLVDEGEFALWFWDDAVCGLVFHIPRSTLALSSSKPMLSFLFIAWAAHPSFNSYLTECLMT